MNVLFVHGSHSVKGGDTVYLYQVTRLAPEFGFRCILLSIERTKEGYSVQLLHQNIQIPLDNIDKVKDFIASTCAEYEIEVIHIHTLYMPAITEYCLTLKPVFKTAHSTDLICPGSNKFFNTNQQICTKPFGVHCLLDAYTKKCCSWHPMKLGALYRNVNSEISRFSKEYRKIIVMSEYIRQECINAGIDEKKVEVNYYFTPEASPAAFDPGQKKRLLFFGRLSVVKGLPYILKAVKEVLDKREDVELHIAGSGSQLESSRQLAKSLGITNNVIFHGWQGREDIHRLLETSYLVVVPSIYPEAFGIVGIEAMMCAKPVVAFDVGGISSWLKDQETGFLVPNKDSHALASKIEDLLNDPALYKRMASTAREEAIKRFTPQVHFKKLLEAYQGNSI